MNKNIHSNTMSVKTKHLQFTNSYNVGTEREKKAAS